MDNSLYIPVGAVQWDQWQDNISYDGILIGKLGVIVTLTR